MNCNQCKHSQSIPGDAHISCGAFGEDAKLQAFVVFQHTGRLSFNLSEDPSINYEVVGEQHGILNGWCSWPINFDPIWIRKCNFFRVK
jgi:hypothetical protein